MRTTEHESTKSSGGRATGSCFPGSRQAFTLFPYFTFIAAEGRGLAEYLVAESHEDIHLEAMLATGYWGFRHRWDLLAKILVEIVGEQCHDPYALIAISRDLWRKLELVDKEGQLVEEAMALVGMLDESYAENLWEYWLVQRDLYLGTELLPLSVRQDPAACDPDAFLRDVRCLVQRATASEGVHGDAVRSLGIMHKALGGSWRCVMQNLSAANYAAMVDRRFPTTPYEALVDQLRIAPERWSRDARYLGLFSDPPIREDMLQRLVPFCFRYSLPTPTEMIHQVSLPPLYKKRVLERFQSYCYGASSSEALIANPREYALYPSHSSLFTCRVFVPEFVPEQEVERFVSREAFLEFCHLVVMHSDQEDAPLATRLINLMWPILGGVDSTESDHRNLIAACFRFHAYIAGSHRKRKRQEMLDDETIMRGVQLIRRLARSAGKVEGPSPMREIRESFIANLTAS